MKIAMQDGAQFYDMESGELIHDYSDSIINNTTLTGARIARVLFTNFYDNYRMATESELFGE